MVKSNEKGNAFEWEIARRLSLWLSDGLGKDHLVRSVASGGWAQSVTQIGDLAPNSEIGFRFRVHFMVECKHWKNIDWWWYFSSPQNEWKKYWFKTKTEAREAGLIPLYITKMNHRPVTVAFPRAYRTLGRRMELEDWQVAIIPLADFFKTHPLWYYDKWPTNAHWR